MFFQLKDGRFQVEARDGYLHVAHSGALFGAGELVLYRIALENEARDAKVQRLLVELRGSARWLKEPVGVAWWTWVAERRVFHRTAIWVPDRATLDELAPRALAHGATLHLDPSDARAKLVTSPVPILSATIPRGGRHDAASEPEIRIEVHAGDEDSE